MLRALAGTRRRARRAVASAPASIVPRSACRVAAAHAAMAAWTGEVASVHSALPQRDRPYVADSAAVPIAGDLDGNRTLGERGKRA